MKVKMMSMPAPSRAPNVQCGWLVEQRQEEEGTTGTGSGRVVQDGGFYRKWISRELEEE